MANETARIRCVVMNRPYLRWSCVKYFPPFDEISIFKAVNEQAFRKLVVDEFVEDYLRRYYSYLHDNYPKDMWDDLHHTRPLHPEYDQHCKST